MDLIALSNDKGKKVWSSNAFYNSKILIFLGEVIVQRLNLQVLWTQPPPFENARVCGIGWRPDERILAIGMNTNLFYPFSFLGFLNKINQNL